MSTSSGTTVQSNSGKQDISSSQLISGGASFFTMFSDRQQSLEAAKGLRSSAQDLEQNARVEKVNADATKNELQRRLNTTLANNAAALSIANVDPTSGSARLIQEQSEGEFNTAFFNTDLNSRIRVAQLKRQAAQARTDASAVNRAGKTKLLIDFGTSIAKFAAGGAF
jgi:hypothetical protein